jgi:hypothetical protein
VLLDLQQMPIIKIRINRLDVKLSPITRNTYFNQKIRGPKDDVSNRTRSKIGHIDQDVGDRPSSKLQAIYKSTSKGFFFPLYDTITFKGQENLRK